MIRTPKFWQTLNIFSLLLYPLSLLYRIIFALLYTLKSPKKFSTNIICIGNAIAGGSGKTPSTIMLAKELKKQGYKVGLVCKNYKANIKDPIKVTKKHSPPEIVDEAVLLSKISDTFTAKNITDAITLADKQGFDFIITDDGLQNNRFHKDVSILVINGNIGVGNNLCIPAGPLREPIKSAISHSHYVFFIGKDKHHLSRLIDKEKLMHIEQKNLSSPKKNTNYIAFTGIAYPSLFFETLEKNDYKVLQKFPFPDHYVYSKHDLGALLKVASKNQAKLITTEKDFTKIDQSLHCKIDILPIEFTAQNVSPLIDTLKKIK